MSLPQIIITRQMVLAELIKVGISLEIAEDLSYRYYNNELTRKDIEYLENNFNFKLEKLETSLKADFKELDSKIDNVKTELKADFKELDNKIDKVENNLNNKIEKVETSLKSDIKELDNKINTVEISLKADIKVLDKKIDTKFTELDTKINNVETSLKSDIASVSNEVALVRKDMEMHKIEIKNELSDIKSELKSSSKLNGWMFGAVITLFVGILLTLVPIAYSLLKK